MSKLLFRLRNVPEDEAQEVRDLLADNDIDTYETFAGNWGISMPGIWARRPDQIEFAQGLLEDYQRARQARMRAQYEQARSEGESLSLLQGIQRKPLQFIAIMGLVVLMVYLSTFFFLGF
ncbi:MAG: hypothetical protein COC19_00495 [SAR86 cluster bacterium]|uniref:DUF2007 domain-containing protein n=1 Tax=SAR86 cluster bacterium TaxID=2030880 RepID=A0A2A4MVN4_9GAMM|nr:MAG: hypothetical protein COC19_00495 [SAR86 cluster bacterium]